MSEAAHTPTEAKTAVSESAPVWPHVMWHTAEMPSGVAMVPYRTRRPVDQESLAEVVDLWKKNTKMTAEEFYTAFDEKACADWSKMQPDGSSFGGAWDAPEGSAERRDAWETTRRANGKALAALPYPPQTVLYAIDYLCARRCESVTRVADWLAWIHTEARSALGAELPLAQASRVRV